MDEAPKCQETVLVQMTLDSVISFDNHLGEVVAVALPGCAVEGLEMCINEGSQIRDIGMRAITHEGKYTPKSR